MKFQLVPLFSESDDCIVVSRSPYCIGRAADCDLRLPNLQVSRHHCELLTEGDTLFVRDMQSSNGTFVNEQRVHNERALKDGDILMISSTFIRIKACESDSGLLSRFIERLWKSEAAADAEKVGSA